MSKEHAIPNKEIFVGTFVLFCLLCVGYLTIKLGRMEFGTSSGYALEAQFSSVSGLRTGASVEIAGVRVGQVRQIRLDGDNPIAIVTLQMNNNIQLTDDVIASVKTSGLIGDKYIDLQPGGIGEVLQAGDTIMDTESAVDLEALISKYVFGGV